MSFAILMVCNQCDFFPPDNVWKSKSTVRGILGQKSPILSDQEQMFPAYMSHEKKEKEHALSFITKEECRKCNKCILKAYESIFYKDEIIFENIENRELRLKNNNHSKPFQKGPGNFFLSHDGKLVRGGVATMLTRNKRERYNFHDEPQEIKDAVFYLVRKLFSVPGFLSPTQAKIFAKLNLGRKLRKSTERNTKSQLKKKLQSLEYIVDYWKDLEELL